MPVLKLLFRRTLATTAVNPTSVLPSPSNHRRQTMYGVTINRRSTLASGGGGARLGAHVKKSPNIKPLLISTNNNIRKQQKHPHPQKLYILCSSSHSSPFSSSSPKFEERENSIRVSSSSTSSSSNSPSSSEKSPPFLVADMGHENNNHHNNQNGDVLSEKRNNSSHQQQQSSKLLTLPTVLTLARVAAIPVFIGTFYVESWWGTAATTSLFIAAAITDWLDGYLARKMGLGTAFGAFLDPVADKLMVAATLVLLCSRPPETAILGDVPWLFPVPAVAIIGREITMSAVREWAASQNTKLLQAVAVNNLGKWKTATQMTALTMLLATRESSLAGPGALVTSGVALLYISAGLAVWSLVVYMRKIWKVLLR